MIDDTLRAALDNLATHHELSRVAGNTHSRPDRCEFVEQARAVLAASATDEAHTHRIEYPSTCTGCKHLAAAFVASAPEWMRGRPAVPEALQERLTREGTVEAIEEAANAAAKAYADHGLSSDPFHAIVMPLRRALGYLARPVVPEALATDE